jgi:large subunit ribosomal protein L9
MMEIILLERIDKLGQMGDVVNVKDGYARNYLLPQKKALRATKTNLERFEQERVQLEARSLEQRTEAEAVAARLEGLSVVMLRQAAESAQLYGSVNAGEVARAVDEAGFSVERRQVKLGATIKTLGLHSVPISLHPEVSVNVTVNVARSAEEAELQAKAGEALTAAEAAERAIPAEAEEGAAVERFFEEEAAEEATKEIAEAAGGDEAETTESGPGKPLSEEPESREAETPPATEPPEETTPAAEQDQDKG